MARLAYLLRHAASALLVAAPTQLLAATPVSDSAATVDVLRSLSLQKLEDMEFGGVMVTGAGTAIIGTPHAARFRGAASGGAVVIIRIPRQPITLTRVGGTETLSLSNFTLDGASRRQMAQSPTFEFRVGGRLNIGANPVDGDYVGTFTVEAQYP
jgi:hypothetical protein